jgi:hypothetical protein
MSPPEHGYEVERFQNRVSHLYGQLIHGCRNTECTEPLCLTGRRNTANRPARDWTPRSARGLALYLAARKSPKDHLCRFYSGAANGDHRPPGEEAEGPRDPNSLQQRLCDTSIIRTLCSGEPVTAKQDQYADLHRSLAPLLIRPTLSSQVVSNKEAARILTNAICRLLKTVPEAGWDNVPRITSPLVQATEAIQSGCVVPEHNSTHERRQTGSGTLDMLDALADVQALAIMRKICLAVYLRRQLEDSVAALASQLNPNTRRRGDRPSIIPVLADTLAGSEKPVRLFIFFIWLQKVFLSRWDNSPTISDPAAIGALDLLEYYFERHTDANGPNASQNAEKPMFLTVVSQRLGLTEVAENFYSPPASPPGSRQLLLYRCLFTTPQKVRYFRAINHIRMREAHSLADKAVKLRIRLANILPDDWSEDPQLRYNESYYLLLNVSRIDILRDTYSQLWQRRQSELFRPLRVRLGEVDELEIGQDLGGVQIEFFNLVCRQIFSEEAGMFTALEKETGNSYFRPGSPQPLYMFELFGLLVALAIYNGITIPISMPRVFYSILLNIENDTDPEGIIEEPGNLTDIHDGWPSHARSLRQIIDSDDAIEGLDYNFPMDSHGLQMSVVLPQQPGKLTVVSSSPKLITSLSWPGWTVIPEGDADTIPLTSENKTEYVKDYILWLTYASVWPQWTAFKSGFKQIFNQRTLSIFTADELKACLEGSTHLDLAELRRVTKYEGFEANSKYIQCFWQIVGSWPELRQRQLLKFVTAAERIPVGGAGNIVLVIQKMGGAFDGDEEEEERLPTSSTCFGTLNLPHYRHAKVLERKLKLAIEYGPEGFGTG